jgi:hypothetical protein
MVYCARTQAAIAALRGTVSLSRNACGFVSQINKRAAFTRSSLEFLSGLLITSIASFPISCGVKNTVIAVATGPPNSVATLGISPLRDWAVIFPNADLSNPESVSVKILVVGPRHFFAAIEA